jgi:SAM-dependent methyltransferase
MTDDDTSAEPEFATMARWTVDAVRGLGDDHALAAACRGSGGPAALAWLADHLELAPGDRLLDVGAGMGGPAAWARSTAGAAPVLVEPMIDACGAAVDLFQLPAMAATAEQLPLPDASVTRSWCLGVLCTTSDLRSSVRELARVLATGGRCGLLVYVRQVAELDREPQVNHFPAHDELTSALESAGLRREAEMPLPDLPGPPRTWREHEDAVDAWIERAHGHTGAWRDARRAEDDVAHLLETGQIAGHLLALGRDEPSMDG